MSGNTRPLHRSCHFFQPVMLNKVLIRCDGCVKKSYNYYKNILLSLWILEKYIALKISNRQSFFCQLITK